MGKREGKGKERRRSRLPSCLKAFHVAFIGGGDLKEESDHIPSYAEKGKGEGGRAKKVE